MSIKPLFLILTVLVFAACDTQETPTNTFSSESDTLYLQSKKIKGHDLMLGIPLPFELGDSSDIDSNKIPPQITNAKLAIAIIDFKPVWYNNLKRDNHNYLETFLSDYYPSKIDTTHIPSKSENSIQVIYGEKDGESIFILDENNNRDFRDDSIRALLTQKFDKAANPIKLNYKLYNGKRLAEDSGWISIGKDESNRLAYMVTHHIEARFFIDNQPFEIEVINNLPYLRFSFESPHLAITSENNKKKDSIKVSEKLNFDDYLKLGNHYYQFTDISNNGSMITLTKENDVSNKISNQVGFIAPDFEAVSTMGDSLKLADFKEKKLLLVNVSACWSDPMSYDVYKELSEAYENKLDILVIDESPVILDTNIDKLDLCGTFIISTENKILKDNYRQDYCSRTCFLIDENGRVLDTFEIFDWKKNLANYFE